jgi:hypothetical protein
MLAILDSSPTAFIPRRLRASLLLRHTLRRLPVHTEGILRSKRPGSLMKVLQHQGTVLRSKLHWFRPPRDRPLPEQEHSDGVEECDYYDLLHRVYRPKPLPVKVHLFTTAEDVHMKYGVWRAYACGGMRYRRLFEDHYDYDHSPLAHELAVAIRTSLEQVEEEEQ